MTPADPARGGERGGKVRCRGWCGRNKVSHGPKSGTLQGERGRAAFSLETGKVAPLAASFRGRHCRPYLASGIVTRMGGNRSDGSVASAIKPSPKGMLNRLLIHAAYMY